MKNLVFLLLLISLLTSCSNDPTTDPIPVPPPPPPPPPIFTPTDTIPVITSSNAKQILIFERTSNESFFINSYDSSFNLRWSANGTGTPDMIHSYNNNLYAVSTLITQVINYNTTAYLTKINASTGQIIWQKVFPNKTLGVVVNTGDSLLINVYNGYLLTGEIAILSAQTGNIINTINMPNGFYPFTLTPINGVLYFYTNRGGVQSFQHAYDLSTNSFKWSKPATTTVLNGDGRIYNYNNALVTASAGGKIAGINKVTGEPIWINTYEQASYGNVRYYYPPTNADLFFANVNIPGKIVALVPETGAHRWEWNNAGNDFIWEKNQQDNNLFFLIVQNIQPYIQFIGLNAQTGKEYYRSPQSFFYHRQFVTAGRYSYTFDIDLNRTDLPNVPTKLLKFDNLNGKVIDSVIIPNGKIMLISN